MGGGSAPRRRKSVDMEKIGVIGGGSWATAIVKILLENVESVGWYVRNEQTRASLRETGHNPNYLSDVHFPSARLCIYDDVNVLARDCDIIFMVVPSAFLAEWLKPLTADLTHAFVVTSIKGIVPEHHLTPSEYLKQHFGLSYSRMGVVSGPCHAEEVALERLSYLTVTCKELEWAARVSRLLRSSYIRTIEGQDIYGTEYSAILKNIYAVAAGVCHGLGYGDNFQAVLISNAQDEITRFLNQSYPAERDTNTSAYLGDLLVTCYSQFSRNRTFGAMIGKGYSVKSAQLEMKMVAEGYYATAGLHAINQEHGIRMPIAERMYNILYEGRSVRREMSDLLAELK